MTTTTTTTTKAAINNKTTKLQMKDSVTTINNEITKIQTKDSFNAELSEYITSTTTIPSTIDITAEFITTKNVSTTTFSTTTSAKLEKLIKKVKQIVATLPKKIESTTTTKVMPLKIVLTADENTTKQQQQIQFNKIQKQTNVFVKTTITPQTTKKIDSTVAIVANKLTTTTETKLEETAINNFTSITLQRTTRSPKRLSDYDQLAEAYPWYWLTIFGFIVSSLIGLLIYCSMRRCRHQQRSIRRATTTAASTIKNRANPPNSKIILNEKNESKASLLKLNGHITDESLVSRCTTITTDGLTTIENNNNETNKLIKIEPAITTTIPATTTNQKKTTKQQKKNIKSKKKSSDDSEEELFKNGKELSVIDPFLNKEYSGKIYNNYNETTTNN